MQPMKKLLLSRRAAACLASEGLGAARNTPRSQLQKLAVSVRGAQLQTARQFFNFSTKADALHLQIPADIERPEYAEDGEPAEATSQRPRIYDEEEIVRARFAGRLARKMLDFANSLAVQPDKYTTNQIDALTREEIARHGAYPSPLNYRGFPKSICTSVNEVVCHGIPDDRMVRRGDLVSIDISLYLNGMHGDNCGSVICGGQGGSAKDVAAGKLIAATQEALDKAVALCRPGACVSELGAVIDEVAKERGFAVVHEFCGHGTGELLHMPPFVRHFRNGFKVPMQPGMLFTIEPIFVERSRRMTVWRDGWSAATMDGGRGAQFEHEVLITEDGCEVLTVPE
jgi:methionyl aminopeptidase